jgi:hypothetical protein
LDVNVLRGHVGKGTWGHGVNTSDPEALRPSGPERAD